VRLLRSPVFDLFAFGALILAGLVVAWLLQNPGLAAARVDAAVAEGFRLSAI